MFLAKLKKMLKSLLENLFISEELVSVDEEAVKRAVEAEQIASLEPERPPERARMIVLADNPDDFTMEDLERLLKEALSGQKKAKKLDTTPYILGTDEAEWFYDPINKAMVRVPAGASLIIADDAPNSEGKVTCYTDVGFIMVPFEQIFTLGPN